MKAIRRALNILRKHGARAVVQKIVARAFPFVLSRDPLVDYEDVLAVDWRTPHPWVATPRVIGARPVIAWVMSPPGANSGGHQNIVRFVRYLEQAGFETRIYLYTTSDPTTLSESRERVAGSSSYADISAVFAEYPAAGVPDDVDVLIATGWETAYRSYRDSSNARRLYFVQDFEPLFYPTGSEALLAENTYRFGFIGITAGGWLAAKLHDEYGMATSSFPFGAAHGTYSRTVTERRSDVFFYARPETPRRGFEIGVMALDLFSRQRPESRIIMAGQDLRSLRVPFAHENPGNMQVAQLNDLYNRCAAGLVLSLTNMSLLPLELLAAGVIPVVNDAPNNRLVSDNPFIDYSEPSPHALADRLVAIVDRADQAEYSRQAAESVRSASWDESGEIFLTAVRNAIHG